MARRSAPNAISVASLRLSATTITTDLDRRGFHSITSGYRTACDLDEYSVAMQPSQVVSRGSNVPDPFGITLKCPKCGYPLTYVRSEGPANIYGVFRSIVSAHSGHRDH